MTLRPAHALVAAGLATLMALTSATLDASVIVPAGLRSLATEASTIVLGRVTEVRAQTYSGRRRVDSVVVVSVDATVKGDASPTVIFKVLGGQSGRYRTFVPGSPVFRPGDEAVLFLGRGSVPYPVGLSHGVFRVRRDRLSGERRVLPPPMLLDPRGAMTVRRSDGTRVPVSVDRFLTMVRRAAAGAR